MFRLSKPIEAPAQLTRSEARPRLSPIARNRLTTVAVRSATRMRNVAAFGVLAVASAVCAAGGSAALGITLLLLAMMVYGALVCRDIFKADLHATGDAAENAARMSLPGARPVDPEDISPIDLQRAYRKILDARDRIGAVVASERDIAKSVVDTIARCGDLVLEAGRIARHGTRIHGFLRQHDPGTFEVEIVQLERRARETSDEQARTLFLQAARFREDQLRAYRDVDALYQRSRAHLAAMHAALSRLELRMARTIAGQSREALVPDSVTAGLDDLGLELDVLEASMQEAAASQLGLD